MRRAYVLASAGAALVLASCSGKPNDLAGNRYYEDPGTTTSLQHRSASGAASASQAPAATPTSRRAAVEPERFAMTAADLAVEGVQPAGTARTRLTALTDCQVPLGAAESAFQATWTYPTGSTIRQYLAAYDGHAADVVTGIRAALTCEKYRADGAEVRVGQPVTAGNGQVSWCATSTKQATCTVVEAAGPVLSVVTVTAATENKARPAVTRIAPLAATALARNS